jgi:hypothetical protein
MPTYTVRNKVTEEEYETICSWNELQELLEVNSDLVQGLSTAKFVSQHGSTIGRTSGDWRDLLKKLKKGSGANSNINY